MVPVKSLVAALELEPAGDGRFTAGHAESGHGVVFGGQLLAQSIVAALHGQEGRTVKTISTVFARAASPDAPLEIDVDAMHGGRAFASSSVTIRQGDRLCVRSLVLLTSDEPDLIRHAEPAPDIAAPPSDPAGDTWEVQIVDDVDISDPDGVGPADLDVWTRFPGAPSDPAVDQALLSFATDGFLIGTAMRPHAGVGQAQAHKTLSTGVVGHTLTFHEPAPASDWLLLRHHSPYAGRGRSYGRADVFAADGTFVASFVQDAMIRRMEGSARL